MKNAYALAHNTSSLPAHVFQCVPCSLLTACCLFPCIAGSVVNVPTDLSRVQSMLPRTFDQSETLMVGLKRKLGHKTAYLQQNIRPTAVWEALRDLMPTPLYKDKVTLLDEQDWAQANADVFEGETRRWHYTLRRCCAHKAHACYSGS